MGCTLAIIVLALFIAFALKPQAELINANLPWWAWLIAVLLVLLESAICVGFLLIVSQSKAQTKLFVATMKIEGQWKNEMGAQSVIKDMNLVKKNMIVRLLTLPIQLIPIVGGAVYSAIHATFTGWDYMDRYFDAIELPTRLQRMEVFGEDNTDCSALFRSSTYNPYNQYARFGFMVGFLEAIPVVGSVVFPLTNAVAAALFASDIEKAGGPACLRISGESCPGESSSLKS